MHNAHITVVGTPCIYASTWAYFVSHLWLIKTGFSTSSTIWWWCCRRRNAASPFQRVTWHNSNHHHQSCVCILVVYVYSGASGSGGRIYVGGGISVVDATTTRLPPDSRVFRMWNAQSEFVPATMLGASCLAPSWQASMSSLSHLCSSGNQSVRSGLGARSDRN